MRGNERMHEYDKELLELIPSGFDLCRYRSNDWFNLDLWFNNIFYRKASQLDILLRNHEEASLRNRQNINIAIYPSDEGWETAFDRNLVCTAEKDNFDVWLNDTQKYNGGRQSFAEVSLTAPDEVLAEAFLSWVRELRRENEVDPEIKTVSKALLGKWREARVIEYIDLIQWLEINEIDATYGQIGNILFPDDKRGGVGDRVRKTTKKWADKLMNNRFIMSRLRYTKWKENH